MHWPSPLPLLRESAQLLISEHFHRPAQVGEGRPVLLLQGLFAADESLMMMAGWLSRSGYRVRRAGILSNVDCSEHQTQRLQARLQDICREADGQRAWLIGHSRGGLFARVLAVRHPEQVAGIITLGSPLVDPFLHIHPLLQLELELMGSVGDLGLLPVARHRCLDAQALQQLDGQSSRLTRLLAARARPHLRRRGCCEEFWQDLRAPFPADVHFLSLYSRRDAVVDWEACLDPAARCLEMRASHLGMASNLEVYRQLSCELQRQPL